MPLPDYYIRAMNLLGQVCEEYRRASGGDRAWLVGGASIVILTAGEFHSGDFDLVVSNENLFREILLRHGFVDEKGKGKLHVGFMHPSHPNLGWQMVTGPLFDNKSDKERGVAISFRAGSVLTIPATEDLIADRLGQYAAHTGGNAHFELVEQARAIFKLASGIDQVYLARRVAEEGGDLNLLKD